jgi:xanthosine utilization system XapX-like protein
MRYYMTFVMLGLLLGGLCLLLEVRPAAPTVAMTGLFGVSGAPQATPAQAAALPA